MKEDRFTLLSALILPSKVLNDIKSFVTKLSPSEGTLLREHLKGAGFEFSTTPYALFTASRPKLRCTFYTSGKLVLQGKGVNEFIEFTLEPQLGRFFQRPELPVTGAEKEKTSKLLVDHMPKIGQDEAGKGDLFGPLCVSALYISDSERKGLQALQIRDGKTIKDQPLRQLAVEIKALCPYVTSVLVPSLYNERYEKYLNLNTLLARTHAQTFQKLSEKTHCRRVLIDQFAYPGVLLKEFHHLGLPTQDVQQRVRAEDDLAVACASILARDAFLDWLEQKSREIEITLPKGAGQMAFDVAVSIFKERGAKFLQDLTKWHFKTIKEVMNASLNEI